MKYLLIIFLFASCTKEQHTQCYTCTYGAVNGYTRPPDNYCGPMPYKPKDASGNELSVYCIAK